VGLLAGNTGWVMAGSMLLGLSSGLLGAFALLRRRALLGDTLAHAALPGVCVAYLLVGSKQIGFFLIGAAVAGILGTLAVSAITLYSKIKEDSAMALVLTVFFGVGIMLLTMIQKMPRGNQSGLDKFLFGQAASLVLSDVKVMGGIAALLCLLVLLLFKEFKLLAFDPAFGAGLGLPVGWLDLLLNLLIVLAVVIGLEAVGVVLMAALLITPAVAARYWTERLSVMVALSGLFGALAGSMGTLLSLTGPKMPTGPLIVLSASALFVVSLLFGTTRGLLAALIRFLQVRHRLARESLLGAMYELAEEAGDPRAAVSLAELKRRKGLTARDLPTRLRSLEREGLAVAEEAGWSLSEHGLGRAYLLVREQRLWEVFLMHEGELGGHQVDRDSSDRAFPAETRQELERLLRLHGLEPRLQPALTEGM
jgi:manganese/zinc/iron transport system permease protein